MFATNCSGRKRAGGRRVARKELLGETKKLKKLFVRKKWPIRPGLKISQHLNFVRCTLKHVKREPEKLNEGMGLEGIRRKVIQNGKQSILADH